jgi:methyl-accepting chemotaxis protein
MTIKAKILALVAAFALMAAGISALGLATISDYDRVIADYSRANDDAFRAEHLSRVLSETVIRIRNIYAATSTAELDQRARALRANLADTWAVLADWKAHLQPGEMPQFNQVQKDTQRVMRFAQAVIVIARTQGPAEAEKKGFVPAAVSWRESFQDRLDALVADFHQKLQAKQTELKAYQARRITEFLAIAASGTILLLLASLWVAIHSIANPIRTITGSIIRISEGAYDTVIPEHAADPGKTDEISRLWAAIAILRDRSVELKRLNDAKLELILD